MASSSASGGAQGSDSGGLVVKFDPHYPLWRHVEVLEFIAGGGVRTWICPHCAMTFKSSYTRMKAHLTSVSGTGIRPCKKVDKNTIAMYVKEQEEATIEMEKARTKTIPLQQRGTQGKPPAPQIFHPFIGVGSRTQSAPIETSVNEDSSSRKKIKGPLEKAFNMEKRDIADELVARCIYACGLPFNVLRSPYWQQMVKGINEAPQGYVSPNYNKVRTSLLAKEVEHIRSSLQPIRDSWKDSGVSIISDGWKDSRNRPLINIIAVSPKGAMFLKAVDCEGEVKDAQFIASILIEAIESVGPQNVVQVITDNAKNCKAAGLIVEGRYEHIFWTPCAIHSLNLMLQKIGKIPWIEQVYTEANEIQMFVTNHHMSQAIFRRFSKLELLKVAETRFASHTIVLRRLVKVRPALILMVIDNVWTVWRQANTERAQKIKSWILDESWWVQVEYLLSFTEPIISMIRFVDKDSACLGEIYDGIDSMLEKMKEIIQEKEQDPEEIFYNEIKNVVMKRWNKMTTPLHLLTYALNPKYYSNEIVTLPGRQAPYDDQEVANGTRVAFRRLFPDPAISSAVRNEMSMFVSGEASMGELEALCDKGSQNPIRWWICHGHDAKFLRPTAIKLLSQVASNSSAERNWSTYGFIHSAKRTMLASKKAEDLVYVHSNLRLLTHRMEEYTRGPNRLWDIESEITNFEASALDDDVDKEIPGSPSRGFDSGASGSGAASTMNEDDFDDQLNMY